MPRDRSADIEAKLSTLEVTLWDEDPEDDPDREGEGWYFRFGDDASWDGAYESEGIASEVAEEQVRDYYERLDDLIDRYSAMPEDGLSRYLVQFRTSGSVVDRGLFAWPAADGTALTLVDAKDPQTAAKIVASAFGVTPLRLEEHPVTLDDFCRDGVYAHPDPVPPSPSPAP